MSLTANGTAPGHDFTSQTHGQYLAQQAEAATQPVLDSSVHNPHKTLLSMTEKQDATTAQQQAVIPRNNSNVFLTDAQVKVLTEDLGFDANVINRGQDILYATISQNDLLADGVTISAGFIDIRADGGMFLDSGIAATDGLILRTDGPFITSDTAFFDSDNLLGLQLGGDFTNSMDLQSSTLWLDIGGHFTNQGSLTGRDVLSITAGKDILNQNLLSGGTVTLDAGGDIINRVEFSQHTIKEGKNSHTYTTVDTAPQIISTDSLSMIAGNNLDLQGSKLSAAGDISLSAGNDVLLGAVENLFGSEKHFKGGYDISYDRTYDVVSLEAGGNLSVAAGNNLQSEGAQFSAGGIAALSAANELNLLAVTESHYDADKTTKKSTFKKKVTETVTHQEEVQGSSITADNILLNATVDENGQVSQLANGTITMVGSVLDAKQNIIGFGNDITLTAGTYQDYAYSHTSKSSFGGLKSKSREELAQDALLSGSTLSAGGNILLDAGNNLSILASHLDGENIGLTAFNDLLIASGEESSIREVRTKSGGFLTGGSLFSSSEALNGVAKITADSSTLNATGNLVIDAGSATVIGSMLNADKGMQISTDIGDINVLAAKETERNYSKEETIKVGFGDVLKSLTKPGELIQTSGGQLTVKVAEASYDKVDFESTAVEQKGSKLSAGENLTFNSVADILLEGATVKAKGDANLIADGNVTIKEAETTYSETKEEVHGKADLSLVVQHQAVEVVKAAEAVDQAKDQVKQAEADYRKYQKERDQLEGTLAKLEADYQNKVPGVSYNDILELRTLLDDIKGDEAWYQAGIATASANLVSKSTLLLQQTSAAAQSAATYGFNAGLQLNIAATKTDSSLDMTGSLASSISGNNINILTGADGQKGTTLIQGSHLAATNGLNIYTGELNVLASQDTMRSETDTQSGTLTIAQTVWGAAGGPTVNGSFNSAQQQDKQTTHTNSSLTADSLNIVTTGDANIIGGNLHGASLVNLNVGGDLTLESVQDRLSGSSKGFGISGGASFGGVFTNENGAGANSKEAKTTAVGATDGVSGVNGGVNASNSRYQSTETLLSSITGGTVAIDVNGHTQLNGALIAALDAEGKDNGNLNLTTGSFAFNDLTNKSYSSSQSFGVSANLGLSDKANAADPAQSSTESTLNSSTYSYQNQSSTSVDKTLATVGNGSLTIGGAQGSPDGLNRDADAINKELYSIDRTQGNIDLTVDHRLLSEDGRKAIVEDAKRTEILGKAIADLAKESVSLTGSGEGESSVRDHIGTTQDYFTATKNFTQSPENKEHVATLENPNATPEQKQAAYTALANAIATYMGVDPTQAKVLMEKDPEFAGYHSRDTGIVYINDREHGNASDAVNTVGHETQHYLDNQQNPNATQSQQYQSNREEYAGIMGNATEDYLNFNFAQNNYALAGSNTHNIGGTSSEIQRNLNLLLDNRVLLGQENPDSLDSCGPLCIARLQAVTPVTTSPVIPGVGQNDALNQNEAAALALEQGLKDLAGTLGNLGSEGTAVATLTEAEVFGKQLDSFEVFDMLEVGQAYQMPDGNVVVKRGITDVSLEQPGSALLNSYEMVTPTQLGQQGGFLAPDEPAVTALPNPAPINPGLIVLDNTPPEIPGQIGGFEIGESLPNLTGTSVLEGHWSDNVLLAVPQKDRELINGSLSGVMGDLPWVDAVKGSNEISHYPNGTREDADRVFDSMELDDIGVYQTPKGVVRTGTLPDGTRITVRPSDDGRPTLEVYDVNRSSQRPVQKIRFGE